MTRLKKELKKKVPVSRYVYTPIIVDNRIVYIGLGQINFTAK